ncbi:MAG: response regulator [Candidatus Omnitrophica bacterium]|nr:response regulator [Candidatus Omnitrophota bacterium]
MKKKKILIVDDDRFLTESISDILKLKGYDIEMAYDGIEAVGMMSSGRDDIDCILMDIKMPEMDGVTALKKILALKPGMDIIMMTGYSIDELIDEAWANGAREVLNKPFDIERFVELIG